MTPAGKQSSKRYLHGIAATLLVAMPMLDAASQSPPAKVASVQGRAIVDRIDEPLSKLPGDALRGKQLFAAREGGHCVLCHAVPDIEAAGNIGPSLTGVGRRLTTAQLRFRVVDITRLNPDAVMPAFHRTADLNRVAKDYAGRTLLSAQQVEDIVAYLAGLK
jgi:L-cysteine S-thiosulfotransferase